MLTLTLPQYLCLQMPKPFKLLNTFILFVVKNFFLWCDYILFQPSNCAGRFRYPWHESVNQSRHFMETDLFITHPVMPNMLYHFVSK